jgi:hypothetical protein
MEKLKLVKKLKGKKNILHPLTQVANRYNDNTLTPIKLSGVVIPWIKTLGGSQTSDYKIVCSSGLEYFIVADPEWRGVLSCYSCEEVKIVGLLNSSNMTIIPQKIFPKGPTGEKDKVVGLVAWRGREFIKKLVENVNDLGLIPAM